MRKKSTDQEVPDLEYKHRLRILQAVRRKPLLYSEIKRLVNLKPARLEYLLKMLRKEMWVITRVRPIKCVVKFYTLRKDGIAIPDPNIQPKNCKILVEYSLSKLGAAVLSAESR